MTSKAVILLPASLIQLVNICIIIVLDILIIRIIVVLIILIFPSIILDMKGFLFAYLLIQLHSVTNWIQGFS